MSDVRELRCGTSIAPFTSHFFREEKRFLEAASLASPFLILMRDTE